MVAIDLKADTLETLKKDVAEAGYTCLTSCVNITDTEKFVEALETLAKDHGSIDILVNNAGITRDNLLIRMSDD